MQWPVPFPLKSVGWPASSELYEEKLAGEGRGGEGRPAPTPSGQLTGLTWGTTEALARFSRASRVGEPVMSRR